MNDRTFCSEMQELKELLTALVIANGGSKSGNVSEDLCLQYPQSTAEMYLDAGGKWEKTFKINRQLKYITVSVPSGVVMEIRNGPDTVMWFTDESGTMQFDKGIHVEEMTIQVTNIRETKVRWSCRMIFS